ncbi:MAG: phosphoribosyltransferase [Cyclobacteriaceae bacterium]|nr:phosphoribosyltransferase [Cyclobacteriaceae bacterium]
MAEERSQILNAAQVRQKIRRMVYEILEENFKEKSMVMAGVEGQGFELARQLAEELRSLSRMEVHLVRVSLNKQNPNAGEITVDAEPSTYKKKCIVLVDDVLNTGKTLTYAMKPFLAVEVKQIEVAVLVNRSHSLFPVWPRYTGYELSTTLTEHVEVSLGDEQAVYVL